jgi:co-chaperonin GroES (HSP10)
MFAEYAGTPVKVNDQVLKMMKESDIVAIVTP